MILNLRRLLRFQTMTKRRAEETTPPSLESSRTGQDFFGYFRAQVEDLLSQEEKISHHKHVATHKSSTETIGAELSDLKNEKLNALLRQCVWDSIPEVEEMQSRVESMHLMSQLSNKKPSISPTESAIPEDPTFKEVEDDLQLLMKSDPDLVKEIVSKHSSDLLYRLNDTQQQLEKLLDNVVTTCRPMSRGEKRKLQKSIKELPGPNLERVAEIIKNHYVALGREMPDDVTVNMEEEDNILLWRLHYCVAAIESARKLAS
ncbi:PREDICTED: uncharacterized protein LOC104728410 isoform X2 [Camelina sativa]|uniref:Uncharacterized protein LOC104728410 isoform X2 n=1 Tax=Camelina sativa TaxID=90675 RepID=A0ABM1QK60_CAMSA|nr:PREDICTED: uncharacterized protein LOC104728410 isoform X2 [Camelina sativa]XP_019087149.1 PREDICTED: uncharacterized protein LOC104728410 isoform X2 [Camelina sativa]